jgi:hypothetical protein
VYDNAHWFRVLHCVLILHPWGCESCLTHIRLSWGKVAGEDQEI